MRNLDSWVKRSWSSAPAVLQHERTQRPCPRGLRAPDQYRTEELIEEIRKFRVLWNRDARGFYSPHSRFAAYKQVADKMNRRFPELRPWSAEEIDFHWRILVQYEFACLVEHRNGDKPHSFTCRFKLMSFMEAGLRACTDFRTFVPRL